MALDIEQSSPGKRVSCPHSGKGSIVARTIYYAQVHIVWDAVIDKNGTAHVVDPPHSCWRSVFFLNPEKA